MRSKFQILLAVAVPMIVVLIFLFHRALKQRNAVSQLIRHGDVTVQFSSGYQLESMAAGNGSLDLFDTVDAVYLDTSLEKLDGVISLLQKLPVLNRVVLRYQGTNMAGYINLQNEIQATLDECKQEIQLAFPGVEVLTVVSVAEVAG